LFMSILMPILVALHVLVCLMLVLVVLMQRPRSEGLGSAFGGGVTDNVFGSQTTNVLARFTTWMAIGFFVITLLLSILTAKANSGKTEIQKKLLSAPVPESVAPIPAVSEATAEKPATSETPETLQPAESVEKQSEPSTPEAPSEAPPAVDSESAMQSSATDNTEAPAPAASSEESTQN